jgi:hypothetical protein
MMMNPFDELIGMVKERFPEGTQFELTTVMDWLRENLAAEVSEQDLEGFLSEVQTAGDWEELGNKLNMLRTMWESEHGGSHEGMMNPFVELMEMAKERFPEGTQFDYQ